MSIIILFFALLLLLYIAKYLNGNIMAPAGFISLFWSIFIFVSLLGSIALYEWDYYGIFWLYLAFLFLNVSFSFGGPFHFVVSKWNKKTKDAGNIVLENISSVSWSLLLVLIFLGLTKWAFQVYTNGFSLTDFLSLDNLADMNHEFAVSRYSGDGGEGGLAGTIISVLNAMVYAAPLCGGFSYPYATSKRKKMIAVASILPAFLVTMTNNTKAGMIGCLLLFFSSYLIGYYSRKKKWPQLRMKTIVLILLGFMAFLSMMLFSMMLRIGSIDVYTFSIVMQKIIVYAFGNVQSFDIWISRYYETESLTFGTMTFLGIADTLGLAERVQGVYTALLGTSSNVYTAFRGIVSDFGIVGGLFFVALQGFLLRIAVNSIHDSYNPFFAAAFAVSVVFFFTFGMFVSPWTYLSFIIPFFILLFYLFVAYHGANRKKIL